MVVMVVVLGSVPRGRGNCNKFFNQSSRTTLYDAGAREWNCAEERELADRSPLGKRCQSKRRVKPSVDIERIYDYSLGIKEASSRGGRRARRSAFCYEVGLVWTTPSRRGAKESAGGEAEGEAQREDGRRLRREETEGSVRPTRFTSDPSSILLLTADHV